MLRKGYLDAISHAAYDRHQVSRDLLWGVAVAPISGVLALGTERTIVYSKSRVSVQCGMQGDVGGTVSMVTGMARLRSQIGLYPMYCLIEHPCYYPIQMGRCLDIYACPEAVVTGRLVFVCVAYWHATWLKPRNPNSPTRHQVADLTPFPVNDVRVELEGWVGRPRKKADDVLLLVFNQPSHQCNVSCGDHNPIVNQPLVTNGNVYVFNLWMVDIDTLLD